MSIVSWMTAMSAMSGQVYCDIHMPVMAMMDFTYNSDVHDVRGDVPDVREVCS